MKEHADVKAAKGAGKAPPVPATGSLLHQRRLGDTLRHAGVQPRLELAAAGDAQEVEAERGADRVLRGEALDVSSLTAPQGANPSQQAGDPAPPDRWVDRVLSPGQGRGLPAAVRSALQPGFGADLLSVRIHDSASESEAADGIGARAFTCGDHIWLGQGERCNDLGLMAHELVHVFQQRRGPARLARQPKGPPPPPPGSVGPQPVSYRDIADILVEKYHRPVPPRDDFMFSETMEEFEFYWKAVNGKGAPPEAFYDPATRTIHLRPDFSVEAGLHEALHWIGMENGTAQAIGAFGNEGMTEWLTRRALQGRPITWAYRSNVEFIEKLAGIVGAERLTAAFMHGEWIPVFQAVERHLGSEAASVKVFKLLRKIGPSGENLLVIGEVMEILQPSVKPRQGAPAQPPAASAPAGSGPSSKRSAAERAPETPAAPEVARPYYDTAPGEALWQKNLVGEAYGGAAYLLYAAEMNILWKRMEDQAYADLEAEADWILQRRVEGHWVALQFVFDVNVSTLDESAEYLGYSREHAKTERDLFERKAEIREGKAERMASKPLPLRPASGRKWLSAYAIFRPMPQLDLPLYRFR